MRQRPPYTSVALLSASALAYEILLMRLFSIIQWHHFAYMIIGLALLGYGISGTIVAMAQKILLARYRLVFVTFIFLFSLSSVAGFVLAQTIPFNAEEILWDGRQTVNLAIIFLFLTIPFFFAASALCLAFMRFPVQVSRLYAMDLIGAGIGSLGLVIMLYFIFPQSALVIIGITGFIAALVAGWELQIANRLWAAIGATMLVTLLLLASQPFELKLSPYKSLTQTLRINGTQVIQELSSPLGLLSVVESRDVPFRHAPGLSLNATQEPPAQLGIFTDGDNMSVITQLTDKREPLAYLDQITSALPYHLKRPEHVLIIGAGGGADVLQAKFHTVPLIEAIELNPQLISLLNNEYQEFSGSLYKTDNIHIHNAEARDYLSNNTQRYDLIQLALVDAFNASAVGLYALNESYLYTTQALQLYLEHIEPGGYLALTRWIKMPPRDTLKLFATAIEAIRKSGQPSPKQQIVLIRSWQTSTLLIKNGDFTIEEIEAIRTFCDERSFDIAYTPTIKPTEVNRYNVLKQPLFYLAATSLLGEKQQAFIDQYKFNLEPATDDRPYFHHFFKWSAWPEIFQLRTKGGMPLIEWGYMVLIITLLIAVVMSIVLILLPLFINRQIREASTDKIKRSHVLLYFFAIGLAFLFIEIAFMQKFILFLGHPIYAISVSLATFLIFAGVGSHCSSRILLRNQKLKPIYVSVLGIVVLSFVYIFLLDVLFELFAGLPISIKMIFSIMLIAPLAFFMGMPFPMAMANLGIYAKHLVPWAWGINGCASVMSAVLATLLAIHYGFNAVISLGMLLYVSIVFLFPAPQPDGSSKHMNNIH